MTTVSSHSSDVVVDPLLICIDGDTHRHLTTAAATVDDGDEDGVSLTYIILSRLTGSSSGRQH